MAQGLTTLALIALLLGPPTAVPEAPAAPDDALPAEALAEPARLELPELGPIGHVASQALEAAGRGLQAASAHLEAALSGLRPDPPALLAAELPGPGAPLEAAPPAPAPEPLTAPSPLPGQPTGPTAPGPHPNHDPGPALEATPVAHAPASPSAGVQGTPWREQAAGTVAGLLLAMGALVLYHRLTKERLLEHEARVEILELLADHPGLGTPAVADRLGCAYRTARHHLEKLAAFDLVRRERDGRREIWALPRDAGRPRIRLRPAERHLLDLLEAEPRLHLSAIARRLDVAKATAKNRLDRLVDRGLLEEVEMGPLRCFEPATSPQSHGGHGGPPSQDGRVG